ncbi:hypothetical protein [Photobacterium sanctipauli]|uniref:hypothetical protein n=1 Tax=Photobacterium sanctipauli TaxID=1342794 RepID=UPI0005675AFC|nr:hypothetical protein [Photobacterium sanctipauli]
MKKSAFVLIGTLLLSTQVMANDVMDNHLATAGERSAPATQLIQQAQVPSMSIMEAQLHTSGDKDMPAGHVGNPHVNDNSQSVFEYHFNTAN